MIIKDLYTPFIQKFEGEKLSLKESLGQIPELRSLYDMSQEWGEDLNNVEKWMRSPEYKSQKELALRFSKEAKSVLAKVEEAFGSPLIGEIRLMPSLMQFDGFARYDSGSHVVWFGMDHPDATDDYLKVLMAHELSHVYRDHRPEVWGHLGKPLKDVSRQEYLDATEADEHLVSEGLATLFSQLVFPGVPMHVHHYYYPHEMQWCLEHIPLIESAIKKCMAGDQNVWSFYEEGIVADGSPSRTQYFWAARTIMNWLTQTKGNHSLRDSILAAHGWKATRFECFALK